MTHRLQRVAGRASLILVLLAAVACAGGKAQPQAPAPPTPEKAPAPKWGEPVTAPEVEKQVVELLAALGQGSGRERIDVFISLGPALWAVLKEDPSLATLGIPVYGRLPLGNTAWWVEGRAIRYDSLDPFLAHPPIQMLFAFLAKAKPAPATEEERKAFYALISYEIAGEPLTVFRLEGVSMLVEVMGEKDGKLNIHVEDVAGWVNFFARKGPPPAGSTEQPEMLTDPAGQAKPN